VQNSGNNLNGPLIEKQLRDNTKLWVSALMVCESFLQLDRQKRQLKNMINLIPLRDLPFNHINLDTLYLIPASGKHDSLENLTNGWSPAETVWYSKKEAFAAMGAAAVKYREWLSDPERVLLRLWWE
jgi:hypothetical protein